MKMAARTVNTAMTAAPARCSAVARCRGILLARHEHNDGDHNDRADCQNDRDVHGMPPADERDLGPVHAAAGDRPRGERPAWTVARGSG